MQGREKSKKREGGVFHRQDWSQFKPLAKRNLFCKTNICEKTRNDNPSVVSQLPVNAEEPGSNAE